MPDNTELLHAYSDYLSSKAWDYYSTVTFRELRKDAIFWSGRVWGWLEKFDATRAFIACEPHKLEGIHYHILSRHLSTEPFPLSTTSMWRYAFKAFGRSSVAPVADNLCISRYCSKYVVKGNQFDFKGSNSAWLLD